MIRRSIQGSTSSRDPEDERKRSRESVVASLVIFMSFIVAIRVAPIIFNVPSVSYS